MLDDLIRENLKILFCGTAVKNEIAHIKKYYANLINYFWEMLYKKHQHKQR